MTHVHTAYTHTAHLFISFYVFHTYSKPFLRYDLRDHACSCMSFLRTYLALLTAQKLEEIVHFNVFFCIIAFAASRFKQEVHHT